MKQYTIAIIAEDFDTHQAGLRMLQKEINGILELPDLKKYGKPGYHANNILSISTIRDYGALVLITCVENH